MKFTNWVRDEFIPCIAVTSLYVVTIPSVLLTSVTFTVDTLNIGASKPVVMTLKNNSYKLCSSAFTVGIIGFAGSFGFLIIDKRLQQHRLLQSRLAEIERMNNESRELVKAILSQVPSSCKSCKYYTSNVYLLCSVHPTDMQEDCNDWAPNKTN